MNLGGENDDDTIGCDSVDENEWAALPTDPFERSCFRVESWRLLGNSHKVRYDFKLNQRDVVNSVGLAVHTGVAVDESLSPWHHVQQFWRRNSTRLITDEHSGTLNCQVTCSAT